MATETLVLQGTPIRKKSLFWNRAGSSFSLIVLIVLLLLMLFPLGMITLNSFKTEDEYRANGPFALPQTFTLDVLAGTWERTDYFTKFLNSTVISLSVAILGTTISLFNAFALGIGRIRGRSFFLIFFLLAITLPNESLIYPLYYFFKSVKLYDNGFSVILITTAFHASYGTYLLSSAFSAFPRELIEAALIDGCNKMQLLFRIIVPITRPALSVLFVFFFIWTWNDFFLPLIFLISNAKQTVPIAILLSQGERNAVITTQSAAALLGIIPCIIFFILFQRTLARGITAGSLK
jgi:raffinose/stachyose/melibiose transport system permease protein